MCNFVKANGEKCKIAPKKELCGKHVQKQPVSQVIMETKPSESVEGTSKSVVQPVSESTEIKSHDEKVSSEQYNRSEMCVVKSSSYINSDIVQDENKLISKTIVVFKYDEKGYDALGNHYLDVYTDLKSYLQEKKIYFVIGSSHMKGDETHRRFYKVIFDNSEKKFGYAFYSYQDLYDEMVAHSNKFCSCTYWKSNNQYDERLYSLCTLISKNWFRDTSNLWNLAGFMYNASHVDQQIMKKTYLIILKEMTERFSLKSAIAEWNSWEDSKYHPKVNDSVLKSTAGGSNPDKYREWKDKYEVSLAAPSKTKNSEVESDKTQTPFELIKRDLLEIVKDKYKREYMSGAIYERRAKYYYARAYDDVTEFLNAVLCSNQNWYNSTVRTRSELIAFIKNVAHPEFEFIKLDYNMIGFSNGLYDLKSAEFINSNDVVGNVQVRKYIDMDFVYDIDTPLLDAYFRYQFDEETISFIYFVLGRLLTRLDDKFDFMVLVHGIGGAGKSLLMNLIKYAFGSDQVGFLSNSHQEKFGLCEYARKQILACDDLPRNIAKTLPKSDFLSMATRGQLSCPVKGKASLEVADWNIPTIMNSNSLPNYTDDSGEIVRRFIIIDFPNYLRAEDCNTNLENEILQREYPMFLHRCRSTYLQMKSKYNGKNVESFCPKIFIDNRNMLRQQANKTYKFMLEKFEYAEYDPNDTFKMRNRIKLSELNHMFKDYLISMYDLKKQPNDKLDVSNICLADKRYDLRLKEKVCLSCDKRHKAGCCSNYDRSKRTSCSYLYNICIKDP